MSGERERTATVLHRTTVAYSGGVRIADDATRLPLVEATSDVSEHGIHPIRTRSVGAWAIALVAASSVALLTAWLIAGRSAPAAVWLRGPGWWQNLLVTGSALLIIVGFGIRGALGLTFRELSVPLRQVRDGAVVMALVVLAPQALTASYFLVTQGRVPLHPDWLGPRARNILPWFVVMLACTALYEEIVYRGFLYSQLVLKTRGSSRVRAWKAGLISQLIFGLSHIPGHILLRHMAWDDTAKIVAAQCALGGVFVVIFRRTRNLSIAVGTHALINAPLPIVDFALPWEPVLLIVLVFWPRLSRDPKMRGFADVLDERPAAA